MKAFLLDIWHDLREKRLWPVAAVLALGLVAVPVVLSKPTEDPPSAPATTSARKAPDPADLKQLAAVKLDESAASEGSPLDTFDPANPFRPPQGVVKNSTQSGSDQAGVAGPFGDGAAPGDGGGLSSPGGGPTTPGPGGSAPGGGTAPGGDGSDQPPAEYRYVIDVTFTANGRGRRIRTLERLDMLPSQANPLLLFLGVESGGDNAVLLVDSTLSAAGEGSCRPSDAECAFVYIGAGSEHAFTNDEGDSYTLRVNEIRKVKVGANSSKASQARRPKASAAVDEPVRRFVPRLLSDLVSASSPDAETSTPDSDRR